MKSQTEKDEAFRAKMMREYEERKRSEKELKKPPKEELELFTYGRRGAAGENPNQMLSKPAERLSMFKALIELVSSDAKNKGELIEPILEQHGFITHANDRNHAGFKTEPKERKALVEVLTRLRGRYDRETLANKRSDRKKDREDREAIYADAFEKAVQRAGYLRHVRSRMREGQIT